MCVCVTKHVSVCLCQHTYLCVHVCVCVYSHHVVDHANTIVMVFDSTLILVTLAMIHSQVVCETVWMKRTL